MLIDIKTPLFAESITEGTVLAWHKQLGDPMTRGESLVDIETDKVTLEVTAPDDGVLQEILKSPGAVVMSEEVIARLETAKATDGESVSYAAPEHEISKQQIREPQAPAAEEVFLRNALPSSDTSDTSPSSDHGQIPLLPTDSVNTPQLSPSVRRMIAEHKLDLANITTEISGRVTSDDVRRYLEAVAPTDDSLSEDNAEIPSFSANDDAPPEMPTLAAANDSIVTTSEPEAEVIPIPVTLPNEQATPVTTRTEKRVPMSRLRQRIAERLLSAQRHCAILTTFNTVNMEPLLKLRARYKEEFEKVHEVKLGFMSFFSKAAVEALKRFPMINASIDGEEIVEHHYYDLSIAVSSPRGLVVPVLRDVDRLTLAGIESKIAEYVEKARDAKLTLDELSGGTFTITNGGVFGSLLSTPIINPPQSAILGMHKIQRCPVVEEEKIVIGSMMYVALSYDHRIIDGREAVQFLVTVKEMIEDPYRLLLGV